MATIPSLASYNLNPATQIGSGTAYGAVPGAVGLPPSTYSQVSSVLPGLNKLTAQSGNVIGSELAGQLPSGTIGQIQDAAAAFGVSTGMPGSGAQSAFGLEDLGLSALQMQQTGLKDYLNLLSGVGSTQLSPNLITDITSRNAMMTAAPNPTLAANTLTDLASGGGGGKTTVTMSGPRGATTPTTAGPAAYGSAFFDPGGAFTNMGNLGNAIGNFKPASSTVTGTAAAPSGASASTSTGTANTGFDQNYYDFLVSGGLDPSYFMDTSKATPSMEDYASMYGLNPAYFQDPSSGT